MIELLVVIGLAALLTTLAGTALRSYWLTQSLYGGRDELISQIRRAQEQSVSQSHPKVFGVRIAPGSSEWGLVEYDPTVTPATCKQTQTNLFQSGTRIAASPAPSFTVTPETTACRSTLVYRDGGGIVPDRATSQYIFFYARGTATGGSATLENPAVSSGRPVITVTPITGRVTGS